MRFFSFMTKSSPLHTKFPVTLRNLTEIYKLRLSFKIFKNLKIIPSEIISSVILVSSFFSKSRALKEKITFKFLDKTKAH